MSIIGRRRTLHRKRLTCIACMCCVVRVKTLVFKIRFLFWGSSACCGYFIKVIGRTVPRNNFPRCLFTFFSPVHVSFLAGHLQAEYTIIFGKLPHYSGSALLSYRSCFVYVLANTAVIYLICENVKTLEC
jgi:hypothetical protein